ncbi:MAG TPA: YoaK family protein [Streptosporangiaceae bacterium]
MNRPRQQATTLIAIALTFGSGAMDVASFTRLGNVFASVMTGNIVLCGLAIAHGSASLIAHTATAFAGYVAGVAGGTRIAWHHAAQSGSGAEPEAGKGAWAPHVRATLIAELALLIGFFAGWDIAGSAPSGAAQYWLLATATAAMGIQASAVINMGLNDVSTTYLTGTLTGLVRSLASPRRDKRGRGKREGLIRPGVLAGLLAGALLSGLLVKTAPAGVPALPVAAMIMVVLLSANPPRS